MGRIFGLVAAGGVEMAKILFGVLGLIIFGAAFFAFCIIAPRKELSVPEVEREYDLIRL